MRPSLRKLLSLILALTLLFSLTVPAWAMENSTGAEASEEIGTETKTETGTETETGIETGTETETETGTETGTETETETETGTENTVETAPVNENEVSYPAFRPNPATVDGVVVKVSAPEGVFPEGATLSVKKVPVYAQRQVDAAIDTEREDGKTVAVSYTFDISVLSAAGEELQPKDGALVSVSFSLAAVADENLTTQVYHVANDEDTGRLSATALKARESGETVTVATDGFSYYTVEFTYNDLTYVLVGDNAVPLADILAALGLSGEVTAARGSNPALFSAEKTPNGWIVTALQPFSAPETLTVTIGGVDYVIAVTDSQGVAEHNGVQYLTLQEALDAATGGGEVKLLTSITEGAMTVPADGIDLDLGGHTLTIPANKQGLKIFNRANVTVRNGTITGTDAGTSIWINVFRTTNLSLQDLSFRDLSITDGNSGVDIDTSDVLMENCNIDNCSNSGAGSMVCVAKGTLTMDSCTVENCLPYIAAVTAKSGFRANPCSTLTMNSCRITHNTGYYSGGLNAEGSGISTGTAPTYWTRVTLNDTVITGNHANNTSYSGGGMTLSSTYLRMTGGAIYDNSVPDNAAMSNSGADVYVYGSNSSRYTNMVFPKASDMVDGSVNLSSYFWMDTISNTTYENGIDMGRNTYLSKPLGLKVDREPVKVARNMRTGTQYTSLADAVSDAQAGDTIQLCALEDGGGQVVTEADNISINRNLTIDLHEHDLNGLSSAGILTVASGVKLKLVGGKTNDRGELEANEIDGRIDNRGELEITGSLSLKDKILHKGHRLFITGDHDTLKVALAEDKYIETDEDMTADELRIYLLDAAELAALNDRTHDHEDVLIVKGGSPALESLTSSPEIDNPHVRRLHKTGSRGEGLYLVDKIPTGIYLDGQNGSDAAAGTEDAPVKTFAKAKELLEQMIARGEKPDGIYVMGTVPVADSESWSLPDDTKMIRHERFTGALVHVTGSLTLKDIPIDGLSEGGVTASAALIDVDGGTLTLGSGAVVRNNTNTTWITQSSLPDTAGGVLARNGATVTLSGGTITDNEAGVGGGVGLYTGAVLNMSSGEISRNRALNKYHSAMTNSDSYAAGGGVFLAGGTTMNFSGGQITGNSSDLFGGGISLGGYTYQTISFDKSNKAVLNMTGGSVSGNTGRGNGGGIFIQANTVANISAGTISNNSSYGARNGLFAGGGIYVNSNGNNRSLDYGQLNLQNVVITENDAKIGGGGIGSCPTSLTMIYVSSGAAIYGNEAPDAHDVLIDAVTGLGSFGFFHRPDHVAYISHYMLGGGEARWMRGGNLLQTEASTEYELNGHTHLTTHTSLELRSDAQPDAIAKANEIATVYITDNYSGTRGGGIGNNGNIRIGTRWEIHARKVWNDADDYDHVRPASVTVQLRASVLYNGVTTEIPSGKIPYETVVTLSEDNDWQYTWHDLPEVIPEDDPEVEIYKNLEITYWIDEVNVPAGYTSTVTGNMFEGYTVTNTHEPQTTSFRVLKVWDDAGHEEARPEKIVVRLHDGHQGRTLELNAANGWSGSFENLPVFRNGERIAYSLTEDHVPNYVDTVVFDGVAKIFTVTNTYHPRFREVSVVKDWFDTGHEAFRPASITVELYADGVPTGMTLELTAAGRWVGLFPDLPETKAGRTIVYTVVEKNVPRGYIATLEGNADVGFILKNTSETTSFRVTKVWDDAGHEAARPAKIIVRLHDEHQGRTLELSAANNWSGSFENLPVFRNGEKIAYSLTEDHVEYYTDEVSFDADTNLFTVTNTYHPGFREISVVKDWFDTGRENARPASITVELYADGAATGMTLELTEAGRWVGHFKDLPEAKAGQPIVYTVVEKNVPRGYTATVSGNADTGFVIKNTHYSNMPKTGDTALPIPLLAAVNALSLLGFAALLPVCFAKRRRKHGA